MVVVDEGFQVSDHGVVEVGEGAAGAFVAVEKVLVDHLIQTRYIFSIQQVFGLEKQRLPFVQYFCRLVNWDALEQFNHFIVLLLEVVGFRT